MAQQLSTNTFGVAKWVVSPDATQGTHTTISAAMASASSGDTIWVRDGIYTENPTLTPGVSLSGTPGDQDSGNVTVIGKFTMTGAGRCSISNMRLQTNNDYILEVTGSAASIVILEACNLNCTNNTGIHYTSSSLGSGIKLADCSGDLAIPGITLFIATGAGQLLEFPFESGMYFTTTNITSSGSTALASTCSTCQIGADHCRFLFPIETSSTGTIAFTRVSITTQNQNTTCLTTAGNGTNGLAQCSLASGSAPAISIGAGTLVGFFSGNIFSSNTNAVTGAGTLQYGGMVFSPTESHIINTTTQLAQAWTVQQGGTLASSFTAFAPVCAGTTATGSFQSADTGIATAGFLLTSTGSSSLPTWQAPVFNVTSITSVNSAASPYTVLTTDTYLSVDCSAGSVTLLFPDTPVVGQEWTVKDATGSALLNNITITTVSGTDLIDGGTTYVMATNYEAVSLIASSATTYQIY